MRTPLSMTGWTGLFFVSFLLSWPFLNVHSDIRPQPENPLALNQSTTVVTAARSPDMASPPSLQRGFVPEGLGVDDGFDPNANNPVFAGGLQADGKVVVGGQFTTLGGATHNRVGRVNRDGTVDTTFTTDANNQLQALAVQADQKIVMGGFFTVVNSTSRSRIARLNSDGTLDTGFNPTANNTLFSLAVQPDGKILLGGDFTNVSSTTVNRLARVNSDGSLDTGFSPNLNNTVNALAVQPDGKILAGGSFTLVGGTTQNRLARLNPDGTLDTGFTPNFGATVLAVAVQPDGKIVAGGTFTTVNGMTFNRIVRLNPDGSVDTAFNPNASNFVRALTVQPDGKILVGGDFAMMGGVAHSRIARLNPDGTLDASFTTSVGATVRVMPLQPDNSIVVVGDYTTVNGTTRNRIARLTPDGVLDTPLNPNVNNLVRAIAVQPDGKILIGGDFSTVGGVTRNRIARLNADGTLDASFDPNVTGTFVIAIALQPDGKILVGGFFSNIGGGPHTQLARLNADGTADAAFNPTANNQIQSIEVQPDGKILIGGLFTSVNGVTHNRVARLNADGTLDATFTGDLNNFVFGLALQPDGKVLVGGSFTTAGGVTHNRIARLNSDGTPDNTFTPGVNNDVNAIVVQPDGNILISGAFTTFGATTRNRIARIQADGSLDTGFDPNAGSFVLSLGLQTDGKIILGGGFTTLGGGTRNRLGRVNADGTLDTTFDPNADNQVQALAFQADGKLLVGGLFANVGGVARSSLARLSSAELVTQSLTTDTVGSQVDWFRGGAGGEVDRVTFEQSADGVTFTPLGNGSRISGGWELTGLSISAGQHFYVRARAFASGGQNNGSKSITESIADLYRPVLVNSINRVGASPACGGTVSWTVALSVPVTGGATSNFALTTTGLTGASITGVAGSGATRTVTASTGTGSGTIRLDMVNSTGVSPTVTNLPFTIGQAYSINPSPTLTASSTPFISGGTLTLTCTPGGGSGIYTSFSWTGPAGFTSNVQNPPGITSATTANTGTYMVTVTDSNGCTGTATTVATILSSAGATFTGVTVMNAPGTAPTNPPPATPITGYGTVGVSGMLTNTSGGTLFAPLYFQVTELDTVPVGGTYWLDSRTNAGNPATVGATQTVLAAGSLANNATQAVTFRVAAGPTFRQQFKLFVELYGASNTSPQPQKLGQFALTIQSRSKSGAVAESAIEPLVMEATELKVEANSSRPLIGGPGLQSNPVVAVDAQESKRMAVVCANYAQGVVTLAYTEDGLTWRQTAMPRTAGGVTYDGASDPQVGYDGAGNLVVSYALHNITDNANALVVVRKLLDRLTFSVPEVVTAATNGAPVGLLHHSLALQGSRTLLAWTSQTLAGSTIWVRELGARQPAQAVAQGMVSHPTLALTTDGAAVVGWNDWESQGLFTRTSLEGLSFAEPVLVAKTRLGYGTVIPALADALVTPGFTLKAVPNQPGRVFAVFMDVEEGMDVFLVRSLNHGQSWEVPQRVNDRATGDQFHPALVVDTEGNPLVTFADTGFSSGGELTDVVFTRSPDGGKTFAASQRVTEVSSNTSRSNPNRIGIVNLGERMGLAGFGKSGWLAVWTDTRTGSEDIFFTMAK